MGPFRTHTFHEKSERGSLDQIKEAENDPTLETLRQLQESQVNIRQVHGSLDQSNHSAYWQSSN